MGRLKSTAADANIQHRRCFYLNFQVRVWKTTFQSNHPARLHRTNLPDKQTELYSSRIGLLRELIAAISLKNTRMDARNLANSLRCVTATRQRPTLIHNARQNSRWLTQKPNISYVSDIRSVIFRRTHRARRCKNPITQQLYYHGTNWLFVLMSILVLFFLLWPFIVIKIC